MTSQLGISDDFRVRCRMEHAEAFTLEHSRIQLENMDLKRRLFQLEQKLTYFRSIIDRYITLVEYSHAEIQELKLHIVDLEKRHEIKNKWKRNLMNSMNRTIKVYEQITAIFEHRTEKLTSILNKK